MFSNMIRASKVCDCVTFDFVFRTSCDPFRYKDRAALRLFHPTLLIFGAILVDFTVL